MDPRDSGGVVLSAGRVKPSNDDASRISGVHHLQRLPYMPKQLRCTGGQQTDTFALTNTYMCLHRGTLQCHAGPVVLDVRELTAKVAHSEGGAEDGFQDRTILQGVNLQVRAGEVCDYGGL